MVVSSLTRMHIPTNNSSNKEKSVLFCLRQSGSWQWRRRSQTSRQTNRELTLFPELGNELGQDLIPPQSLVEAAYVCHELLSSNIWGFSQPSNSWGLISWDLPWSVRESGLHGLPSEDQEAFHLVVISWKKKSFFSSFNHLPSRWKITSHVYANDSGRNHCVGGHEEKWVGPPSVSCAITASWHQTNLAWFS